MTDCGYTLNMAAASCTPETFALLLSHDAGLSFAIPLHYVAGRGPNPSDPPHSSRIPMLKYLVNELCFDVNGLDDLATIPEHGRGYEGAPFHYALRSLRYEEAKWLLEHGADPEKKLAHPSAPRARVWVGDCLLTTNSVFCCPSIDGVDMEVF